MKWLIWNISGFSGTAFECNDEVGVIPDPEDCRSFYICDFEHYEHFKCSPGYLFDIDLLVCNYEYEVDCGERPIPGISTTTPVSTVPTTSTSTMSTPTITSTVTTETTAATTVTTETTTTTTGSYVNI